MFRKNIVAINETGSLHSVQSSITFRGFEMIEENRNKLYRIAQLFLTSCFFLAHLSVRSRDMRLTLDV